jgi:hypothetical protein
MFKPQPAMPTTGGKTTTSTTTATITNTLLPNVKVVAANNIWPVWTWPQVSFIMTKVVAAAAAATTNGKTIIIVFLLSQHVSVNSTWAERAATTVRATTRTERTRPSLLFFVPRRYCERNNNAAPPLCPVPSPKVPLSSFYRKAHVTTFTKSLRQEEWRLVGQKWRVRSNNALDDPEQQLPPASKATDSLGKGMSTMRSFSVPERKTIW